MRGKGGDLDYIGKYVRFERPRCLSFTWGGSRDSGPGTTVTVEISPLPGAGCALVLTHELPAKWADFVGGTVSTWEKLLHSLARRAG